MLNATLSIQLDTTTDAADAVRGELAKAASELVVRYGLAGEVKLTVEGEPLLPAADAGNTLGLTRRVGVDAEGIGAILRDAVDLQGVVEIEYRDQSGTHTTRRIEPSGFDRDDSRVFGYDHLRNERRTFRLDRIMRAEAV